MNARDAMTRIGVVFEGASTRFDVSSLPGVVGGVDLRRRWWRRTPLHLGAPRYLELWDVLFHLSQVNRDASNIYRRIIHDDENRCQKTSDRKCKTFVKSCEMLMVN